jgi:hypothetical protein
MKPNYRGTQLLRIRVGSYAIIDMQKFLCSASLLCLMTLLGLALHGG